MKRVLDYARQNRKLVILTFELFWIAVFLLEALEQGSSGMTQFVYVNF